MNGLADPVLVVPGLNGSGPTHWQSWIEALIGAQRVEQDDWTRPDIDLWSARVEQAILAQTRAVWLVAHSFGCLASVVAASRQAGRIAGALLVAPASPDKFGITARIPDTPLPFPAVLAASRNDPWMKFMSAAHWAERWDARLVDLGEAGHVNTESGHGPWPAGLELFRQLQASAPVMTGSLQA
ncbi:serine hydrolase family protein [Methyloversatilis sp. RAC08]|uniref:RBBP9/YdeN family alpha/beta hydrolase n=1 Tax=Methyloversatilis sp. RAC08 TaxID=1842540 RepID=UPI00083DDC80|nr:alpha/beta hydrolase [Methyloversatilis sp. RAC08]AOF80674.1 serine hydrolase family protein [Methyloversatilis sp. RAC08]